MKKVIINMLVVLSLIGVAYAGNDLTLTCSETDCILSSSGTLSEIFEEENILPGESFSQNLTVVNGQSNDCNLVLNTNDEVQTPNGFASRLFTVIKSGATDVFGVRDGSSAASSNKNLNEVFTTTNLGFGTIPHNATTVFNWVVTFDPTAGNEFQGANTIFDFDMNFTCVDEGSSEDDDDNDEGDDSDTEEEEVVPTQTFIGGLVSFFAQSPAEEIGEVAGESTPSLGKPVINTILGGDVGGAESEKCTDPWWWWVFFVFQALISGVLYPYVTKDHINKKSRFYLLGGVANVLAIYIYFRNFCPWWDWLLSLVLAVLGLLLVKRKFSKLEDRKYS
ncbi:hypothetical protein A3K34_01230 [candidate division WWE3 bacterium RIFOXYC1_FULL_40_10]|uniref:Uncharacterized protein n=1 Tax=candidate division WWE3 bacterium RIFOXYA2_FULL_46_9 TaxID=1802636 RepID=A0A1F4W1Y1_UNCKA|nr:MAG: hypothetical protein A3K58_01230 [candidate division WWE3 bacterium RIFOXYB1_FULL_40_22]OGC61492.1 MAG: hypothetical protein A3K37_01230 [candidate division WWE3 bacterium RIFOXYA1_FULL_40_11]OGC63424.1 MAG: hypothetical protein A2264_01710 [candidate division WWE3 bacterium RIFOXYA2_FULL_46_9]OGC64546.1 MAG: hypothetical protein A2326_03535 [candidate division WWE3 bacterium RIFOXYB2_FULL_41_6]OGC65875.1 MAG: hypothetical protein A3K34_01230 [candidate division WWE3 bacterium RIFOXYC1_